MEVSKIKFSYYSSFKYPRVVLSVLLGVTFIFSLAHSVPRQHVGHKIVSYLRLNITPRLAVY